MRISFAKKEAEFAPIVINEKANKVVPFAKLLGLIIFKDLKWNCHVSQISRKVSARLSFLKQLKRACVATKEFITFLHNMYPSSHRVRFSNFSQFPIHRDRINYLRNGNLILCWCSCASSRFFVSTPIFPPAIP